MGIRRPKSVYSKKIEEIKPGQVVQRVSIGFPAYDVIGKYLPGDVPLPEAIRIEKDVGGTWYCATDIGTYHGFSYSTGTTESTLAYLRRRRDSIRQRLEHLEDLDRRLEMVVNVLEEGEALSKEIAKYIRRHIIEIGVGISEHPTHRECAEGLADRFDEVIIKIEEYKRQQSGQVQTESAPQSEQA